MTPTRLTLIAASILTLAACGGGGGTSTTGNTNTPPVSGTPVTPPLTVVPPEGSLLTSSPGSAYVAGSVQGNAFDTINAARLASGVGAVTQNPALDVANNNHAAYFSAYQAVAFQAIANPGLLSPAQRAEITLLGESPFTEWPSVLPELYTGHTIQARAVAAGAIPVTGRTSGGLAGAQRIVNDAIVPDGAGCARRLIESVYHADAVLGYWTQASVATATDAFGGTACFVAFAAATNYGQVRPSGDAGLAVNPAPGATADGGWEISAEFPRPAATQIPGARAFAGTAVWVSVYNADYINAQAAGTLSAKVTTFTVTNAAGATMPAVLLTSPAVPAAANVAGKQAEDAGLMEGSSVLVPLAPLPPGLYTVEFAADIKPGLVLSKTWSFTAK